MSMRVLDPSWWERCGRPVVRAVGGCGPARQDAGSAAAHAHRAHAEGLGSERVLRATCHTLKTHKEIGDRTVHGVRRRCRRRKARGRVRPRSPTRVSRRVARSSASRVVTVRPPATVHISLTLVTHALPHIEPMRDDVTDATGEAASRTTPRTTPSGGSTVRAATAYAGAAVGEASAISTGSTGSNMPAMGIVEAATAKPRHVRLNTSATAAPSPRRRGRHPAPVSDGRTDVDACWPGVHSWVGP